MTQRIDSNTITWDFQEYDFVHYDSAWVNGGNLFLGVLGGKVDKLELGRADANAGKRAFDAYLAKRC